MTKMLKNSYRIKNSKTLKEKECIIDMGNAGTKKRRSNQGNSLLSVKIMFSTLAKEQLDTIFLISKKMMINRLHSFPIEDVADILDRSSNNKRVSRRSIASS